MCSKTEDDKLEEFFAGLKKKDGTDYKSESHRTMLAALDKFFRNSGCKYSIAKDKEFNESRKALNGKAVELGKQLNSESTAKGSKRTEQTH